MSNQAEAPPCGLQTQPAPAPRSSWLALAVVSLGLFLAVVSTTVVSVALPTVGRDLHAGDTGLEWVVDSYVLVYASLLVAGGSLGDRHGRKGLFLLDPFLRAEIVHSSERTRITRLFLPGRTVIRKEPLGPDAERRVRHEVAVLERLRGVAGVAQLAEAPRYPGSVVLEDAGGASLAGMTKPLPVHKLAGLGLRLARAVAGMHQRGVIHRDITPVRRFPPTSTPATRWHFFMLISIMRTLPPSSATRPACSGTPRPPCHSFRCSQAST